MNYLETISKMAFAGLAVWRLTRMVHAAFDDGGTPDYGQPSGLAQLRPENLVGSRVMDFFYWIGIWMSAQTALWVACGFAGVLLHWLAFSGVSRLARWSKEAKAAMTTANSRPAQATTHANEDCNRSAQLCL